VIGRVWRGATRAEDADAYGRFLAQDLLPGLTDLEGYRGAYVLRRANGGEVEFLTLTLFDSMEAVARFAGPEPERPVIEPEAERLLARIGEQVEHFEVAVSP
jgi:heme-degrading monooxygenase HmoA